MAEESSGGLGGLLEKLSKLLAFVYIAAMVLDKAQQVWGFIPADILDTFKVVLGYLTTWTGMALAGIVVLSMAFSSKNILIKLVLILLVAAVIIFTFFPDLWAQIVAWINENAAGGGGE